MAWGYGFSCVPVMVKFRIRDSGSQEGWRIQDLGGTNRSHRVFWGLVSRNAATNRLWIMLSFAFYIIPQIQL
jgi:hypothetical protein